MKQNTTSKLKFKKLRRALGNPPLYQAVGLLESMWQFTAADAPRGDIGRFTNQDIAMAVEWQGDPDELIDALVETGWLDESDEHRLAVHHWHEHCPDYLRKRIQRRGEPFVTEQNRELEPANPHSSDTDRHRQTSADIGRQRLPTKPSQAEPEPSQDKPSRDKPARRTPPRRELVPGDSSLPGVAVSDARNEIDSDSGSSRKAAKQVVDLDLHNAKVRIAELLDIKPPQSHATDSKRKQARGDFATIASAVDHWRGNPDGIAELVRLASEVAAGALIKKPMAAWVARLKKAGLFYK